TTDSNMCLHQSTTSPLGGFVTHGYWDQYIEEQSPAADGSGNQWVRTYFDGLGRTTQVVKKGPATGQDIYVDTTYDARGNVAKQSRPYYQGGTVYNTTTNYDALNRVTKITRPDGKFVQTSYGFAYNASDGDFTETKAVVHSYDEMNHFKRNAFNSLGQLASH